MEHELEQDFQGKTVLVTGGNSGIGKATAELFARRGATVAIAARRAAELDKVVADITAAGGEAFAVPTDVADADKVAAMVDTVVSRTGRLDAAFNNAGVMGRWLPVDELTADDFDKTMEVDLRGTWLSTRAEMIQMKQQGTGGAIVNCSSVMSRAAVLGAGLYSAAKAGLDHLVRSLALEAAEHDIRVNTVNPGNVDTPMLALDTPEGAERIQPHIDHTPIPRVGTPNEIAEAAVWLASPKASFVTGQSLFVDGGYSIAGRRIS